jgi:hypothetical protein
MKNAHLFPEQSDISKVFYDNALKSVRIHTCPVVSQVLKNP